MLKLICEYINFNRSTFFIFVCLFRKNAIDEIFQLLCFFLDFLFPSLSKKLEQNIFQSKHAIRMNMNVNILHVLNISHIDFKHFSSLISPTFFFSL